MGGGGRRRRRRWATLRGTTLDSASAPPDAANAWCKHPLVTRATETDARVKRRKRPRQNVRTLPSGRARRLAQHSSGAARP
jgi:hypothetical protein